MVNLQHRVGEEGRRMITITTQEAGCSSGPAFSSSVGCVAMRLDDYCQWYCWCVPAQRRQI